MVKKQREKAIALKVLAAALLLMTVAMAAAQTNRIAISNLGQRPFSYAIVDDGVPTAVSFMTGNAASHLAGVSLSMEESGSPYRCDPIRVTLYSDTNDSPGVSLAALTGNNWPTNGGEYTYTNSVDVALSPNTRYWIVVATTGPGWYDWNETANTNLDSGSSWSLGNVRMNLGSWASDDLGFTPQFSVLTVNRPSVVAEVYSEKSHSPRPEAPKPKSTTGT